MKIIHLMILFLSVLIIPYTSIQAQNKTTSKSKLFGNKFPFYSSFDSLKQNKKAYNFWLKSRNPRYKLEIDLVDVKDQYLGVKRFGETQPLLIENIEHIKYRERGKAGSYAWLGGFVGFVAGAIVGHSEGSDPGAREGQWLSFTAGEKALFGGLVGGSAGAIIGAVVGSFKTKVVINGKSELYKKEKERLTQLVY